MSLSARPVRRKALFTQRPTSRPPAPGAGTGHEASRTLLGVTFKRDTRRGSDQPDPRGMNDFIPELGMNDNKGFRSPSNRGFSVDSVLIKFALNRLQSRVASFCFFGLAVPLDFLTLSSSSLIPRVCLEVLRKTFLHGFCSALQRNGVFSLVMY